MTPTGLDDAALARLRAEAKAHASPFIDPALLREASVLRCSLPAGWLAHITGRPAAAWENLDNAGLYLAVQAAKADAAHLRAVADARTAEYRRAAQARARQARARIKAARNAWQTTRDRLPVPVEVQHNWTTRHLEGYCQGANHIVVLEDLHAGHLYRRARQPLCWTPSRAHELRHVFSNSDDEDRLPDCKACLRRAEKLTAQEG